jgi:hypothetical protein
MKTYTDIDLFTLSFSTGISTTDLGNKNRSWDEQVQKIDSTSRFPAVHLVPVMY